MKQALLFVITVMLSIPVFSQCGKGSHLLGGSLYFNMYTSGIDTADSDYNPKYTNYGVIPIYGYALSDKWVIGTGIGYASSGFKQKDPFTNDETKNSSSVFVINPYIRYYYHIAGNLFCTPSFDLDLGFGSYENKTGSTITSEGSTMNFGAALHGGLLYFLAARKALGINYGSLGYNMTSDSPEGSDVKYQTSDFGLNLNAQSLALYLIWYFKCKELETMR